MERLVTEINCKHCNKSFYYCGEIKCPFCGKRISEMMKEINFYFRKKGYGWLSNFERTSQVIDGTTYPTNEHFYQSQKANNADIREWIRNAPSSYLAMVAGRGLRKKEFTDSWQLIKVDIMLKGLRAKFSQSDELRQKLLDTGNAILHENSATDMFWGKKGKDTLGKLLMQVREEILKESKCYD